MFSKVARERLPDTLTSYDLLKTLAVVLMIIDHIGHFFFPEETWLRVIGRLSMPIWFFLIGYAKTREVPNIMWVGGIFLGVMSFWSGENLLPFNILITLGLTRLSIDWFAARSLRHYEAFIGMYFFLLFMAFPSILVFEYGSLGVMFAMFGYLRRHQEDLNLHVAYLILFIVVISAAYILTQSLLMPRLSEFQLLAFVLGIMLLMSILYCFRSAEYSRCPDLLKKPLQFSGRYTLEIYVLHLFVFKAIAPFVTPETFPLFDFKILPFGLDQLVIRNMG